MLVREIRQRRINSLALQVRPEIPEKKRKRSVAGVFAWVKLVIKGPAPFIMKGNFGDVF